MEKKKELVKGMKSLTELGEKLGAKVADAVLGD